MTNPSSTLAGSFSQNPADPAADSDNDDSGGGEEARGLGGAFAIVSAAIGGGSAIAVMFL